MATVPAFAQAFAGRRRIAEMDVWDNDDACGRGCAKFRTEGRLVGHICIHQADDSGFACEPG